MKPMMTIEFRAQAAETSFEEESVTIHSPEELLAFVAPNGGCEKIPDEVDEIQFILMHPTSISTNPLANANATLELGMVFFSGPIAEIAQTVELLLDAAARGQLSSSFLKVIGVAQP